MGAKRVKDRTRYGKRECSRCGDWKPLDRFPKRSPGVCRECQNAEKAKLYAEGKLKIDKERRKAQRRANYAANLERERQHGKAKRRRVKEDRERYARQLEMARMRYTLDQERKGRDVAHMKHTTATIVEEDAHRVPVEALREAFVRSGLTATELAKRMGYTRAGMGGSEGTRVLRMLGLKSGGARSDRGPAGPKMLVEYDLAVRLAQALDIDPVDAGV